MNSWANGLWGRKSSVVYLMITAILLLLTLLGSREIWTQEHRWADIVSGMFFRHDFFHPFLNDVDYYDKPLLSYWLIAGVAFITGELSTWALRLPSALAGLLAVWSIYRLGLHLKDKRLGLLAGWLLLTTFYFIFWARTSSADMLNMAGSLFAICWYLEKKAQPTFINYAVFFLILSLTALCKGLIGVIVPVLVILTDIVLQKDWKTHLRLNLFLALLPALIIYILPFWVSAHLGNEHYGQNGLYLVYKENILRYFQPFDHKGPIYTYLVFLPIYLLPWTVCFFPALFSLPSRWRTMNAQSKWIIWVVLLLFLFFTFSGSRRNYYVLPIVPFALLMTADWILAVADDFSKRNYWTGNLVIIFLGVMFFVFDVAQPLYYADGGHDYFAKELKTELSSIKPWTDWQFVLLDPESRDRFYLHLSPHTKNYSIAGEERDHQTTTSLLQAWPILKHQETNMIFITRKRYVPLLKPILLNYDVRLARTNLGARWLKLDTQDDPVAFVPKRG